MTKDVALVLSSGGPRGFAYIGAIEELERRGYRITSIAGASIGSLIGGIYASGKLEEFKEWLFQLDSLKILKVMDVDVVKNHLVKGEKVIEAIKTVVPDMNIEDMKIPYKAVATDIYTGERVIFDHGPMFQAIRASISIPFLFKPVKIGHRTLVDGGLSSTLPLSVVDRNGHDVLFAFDVNEVNAAAINDYLEKNYKTVEEARLIAEQADTTVRTVRNEKGISMMDKIRAIGQAMAQYGEARKITKTLKDPIGADDSYLSIVFRSFDIMNHTIATLEKHMTTPDLLVNMDLDSYGAIPDYAKGKEICEKGRALMSAALDRYEGVPASRAAKQPQ